jgi:iron-only hydrogenase group A
MKKIKFTLNGMEVEGNEGDMIIDVAEKYEVKIPRICMNQHLERTGACRICVVEIEGQQKLFASCSTPIREGIVVKTHSPKVLNARKINIELLLANHNRDCLICPQNLQCKLQEYSEQFMIDEIRYEGKIRESVPDNSSVSIKRDNSKCILCGQCYRICNNIQTVNAIGPQDRGFYKKVIPPFDLNMAQSNCINCGQCVIACPTGALSEKNDLKPIIKALNSGKYLVAQTAPSIRATLGECFGMPVGTLVTGKMVTALKEIGFAKVFDTDLGADLTIMEEATEFIKRFTVKKNLPLITTCCPAWIKFGEQYFFEQLNHMSSCKSPQAMLASLIKNYYAKKIGKKSEDIIVVAIMPCTAKKYEILREELNRDTDFVLTTVELGKLLKQFNVDFINLPNSEFDNPLGESSGAGDIFGRTGGVMEAALRTAADFITGKNLKNIEYKEIQGMKTLKEADIKIGKDVVKVAVVHTLGEARNIMNQIRAGNCPYHFVEIMACYGGCVGGGGQPRLKDDKTIELRTRALTKEDHGKKLRKSHKNPAVKKIYKEYIGEPGSEKAHKLLHTKYFDKDYV